MVGLRIIGYDAISEGLLMLLNNGNNNNNINEVGESKKESHGKFGEGRKQGVL